MPTTPANHSFLSTHTFGRDHREPPPLPSNMQVGPTASAVQIESNTAQAPQMYAGGLPHDFDHIVRSVGEW